MNHSKLKALNAVLVTYRDSYLVEGLQGHGVSHDWHVTGDQITLQLVLGFPIAYYGDSLKEAITQYLSPHLDQYRLTITISSKIVAHRCQKGVKGLTNVKNIIAIASGKGGVGKSTVTANLAIALAQEGAKVGVLDADIYGPNQPHMLGVPEQKPQAKDGQRLLPVVNYGIQTMSIGYLINKSSPVVWRGPMVSSALQQLLRDTEWHDIDYLLVDLPPGTGDVQLTLAQRIPVTGAVVVTTPQDIALLDVTKAIGMFQKVAIDVLGVVENMAYHQCQQCGHESHIFGQGGGAAVAAQYQVPLLGQIPLDAQIRVQGDAGLPLVAADPQSAIAENYRQIARQVAVKIAAKSQDYTGKFPNIVIEKN